MSEPVTNVEIEDVLSSIRRLVAEGDKPRASFVPPEVVDNKHDQQAERFVLTPALRVAEVPSEAVEQDEEPELSAESEELAAQFVAPAPEPLILKPSSMLESTMVHDRMTDSERASLEATIAELEAAVRGKPDEEWEPDGSETTLTSGLAEAFATLEDEIEDAEEVVAAPKPEAERVVTLRPEKIEPTFKHAPVRDETPDSEDTDYGDDLRAGEEDGMPIPDDLDETLAAYIASGTAMDRTEIRQLVVEVVRQELQGELGERISRNIRKLVRREIQRATTANIYD